jgi:hypothetical protein
MGRSPLSLFFACWKGRGMSTRSSSTRQGTSKMMIDEGTVDKWSSTREFIKKDL